jgi:P-type conjugative transfer protein TrbJ
MKTFASLTVAMLLAFVFVPKSNAYTVYCTNCSDTFTQQLQQALANNQLVQLIQMLNQSVVQTEQQIQMVITQIQQYENMIKNTLQLPMDAYNNIKGLYSSYAKLTDRLNTIKGDFTALAEVFQQDYPELDLMKEMALGNSELSVSDYMDNMTKKTDQAIEAAFQVTGQTLHDIVQNADMLEAQIEDLLSTPEGQMQAIEAGNQLAAIQIGETQRMTTVITTALQSDAVQNAQRQKQDQLANEQWRNYVGASDAFDAQKN